MYEFQPKDVDLHLENKTLNHEKKKKKKRLKNVRAAGAVWIPHNEAEIEMR